MGICVPRQAVGIAVAVPALVVVAGDRLGRGHQLRLAAREHARAQHGVGLDHLELLLGQPTRLEQDRVRDRDLADVVQRARRPGSASPRARRGRARSPAGRRARRRAACARRCCRRGSRRPAGAAAGCRARPPPPRAGVPARGRPRTTSSSLVRRRSDLHSTSAGTSAATAPTSSRASAITGGPASSAERVQPRAQRGEQAVVGEHGLRRLGGHRAGHVLGVAHERGHVGSERGQPVPRRLDRREVPTGHEHAAGPRAHRRRPY